MASISSQRTTADTNPTNQSRRKSGIEDNGAVEDNANQEDVVAARLPCAEHILLLKNALRVEP
jgi:hypothetical protein